MFAISTHKRSWTFNSIQQLQQMRTAANSLFIDKYKPYIESSEQLGVFFTPDEEHLLCRVVSDAGLRFGHDFKPALPPAVRWIAFMYYKRFFLKCSVHEFTPKNVMMACYFLATKVDEFNISTKMFVRNLKSGNAETNSEFILKLEPKVMEVLDYHLTIHSPYRPFEGHLIEFQTRTALKFDIEKVRKAAHFFFDRALLTDAMLLYVPTQIALAALKYGLESVDMSVDVLKDFFYKFLDLDQWNSREEDKEQVEKLMTRINEISNIILEQSNETDKTKVKALQEKAKAFENFYRNLDQRTDISNDASALSDDSD
jgi:cyclin H